MTSTIAVGISIILLMFMSILYSINSKFDKLKEPKRFIVFMIMALPGITLISTNNTLMIFCGMLYIGFLIMLRLKKLDGKL